MNLRERVRALTEALPDGASVTLPVTELRAWLADSAADAPARPAVPDRLLTVDEAASRLGVPKRWVWDHADALGGVRLSARKLRIPESGLTRHLVRRAA